MAFRLPRRHMLASATAGAAIGTGFYRLAAAQSTKRIEQFAPELDGIVDTAEPINQLHDGVGGDDGPADEAPPWAVHNCSRRAIACGRNGW
jgi:hypothetical protein